MIEKPKLVPFKKLEPGKTYRVVVSPGGIGEIFFKAEILQVGAEITTAKIDRRVLLNSESELLKGQTIFLHKKHNSHYYDNE